MKSGLGWTAVSTMFTTVSRSRERATVIITKGRGHVARCNKLLYKKDKIKIELIDYDRTRS